LALLIQSSSLIIIIIIIIDYYDCGLWTFYSAELSQDYPHVGHESSVP